MLYILKAWSEDDVPSDTVAKNMACPCREFDPREKKSVILSKTKAETCLGPEIVLIYALIFSCSLGCIKFSLEDISLSAKHK